jgi:MTH538 TIR-like domain (DUF1863)
MGKKVCNVFISHIHEDDAEIEALKDLLAKNGCSARDSSVNSATPNKANDPEYIKQGILAPRIKWAGTVLALISPGTHESSYVDWEIGYAHAQGKQIVGVWCQGAKDSDMPKAVDDYADVVVGWNADKIIDAIFGKIKDWVTASGEPRGEREIARFSC